MTNTISRLFYLASTNRGFRIPKFLKQYIPQGEILQDICDLGIKGLQVDLGYDLPGIEGHVKEGRTGGESFQDDMEFRLLLATFIEQGITEQADTLTLKSRIKLFRMVDDLIRGKDAALIVREEASLYQDTEDSDGIITWQTGFEPIDKALGGGFYQGLHVLMGAPGTGKSSTFQKMMATLRKTRMASSLWYFSVETPLDMVRWRMQPLRQSVKFKKDDRIYAGSYGVEEIIDLVQENPDPNRIILYDGPDAIAGGDSDGRRFVIEAIYRDLVTLKQMCRAVFVPSQPKRGEQQGMSLESVAEAWAKAWYADTVTGMMRMGTPTPDGAHRLKMTNFKNRFGPVGTSVYYNIDFSTYDYSMNEGPSFDNPGGSTTPPTSEGDF